ncbi:hypothetical protein hairong_075 [Pseudomonas phage hairong]|nr:hypothetical protein hairong_075 [Pseudomonas phage hairong]
MKIEEPRKLLTLQSSGDDGRLEVRYDTMGEPFREGISLSLERPSYDQSASVFIEGWEVRALRDLLNTLAPPDLAPELSIAAVKMLASTIAAGEALTEADREQAAQVIRDLIPLIGMQDAYNGAREELAIWKKRALEAEAVIRELPTVETVVLQAQKYRRAAPDNLPSEEADLKHLLDGLPTDIVPVVKEK